MLIRDIMTTNVVSIPSNTSLADARRIMDAHRVKRLPVVDKERLVGIVTKNALDKAGPSELTTFSKHELTYLVNSLTVKQVMSEDLVTISPDANVEYALSLIFAQMNKSRAFLVMKNNRLVGIVTTRDFLYSVLSPMVGTSKPGSIVFAH